jgi:hypothetical protein
VGLGDGGYNDYLGVDANGRFYYVGRARGVRENAEALKWKGK